MYSKIDCSLINGLKGRISKILSGRVVLREEERTSLEAIYLSIDKFLLSKRHDRDRERFIQSLRTHLEVIKGSRKVYIRDHIIPVIRMISGRKR